MFYPYLLIILEFVQQIEKPNKSKTHDDFFIVDEEEGKREDTYDEEVAQKLKQDYVTMH